MSRILITGLVLAALSVTSANGLPVTRVKSHKTALPKATPHKTQTKPQINPKANPQTRTQSKAHRATPEEVGRAAGLKIRRDLARHPLSASVPHRQARLYAAPIYQASAAKPVPRMFGTAPQGREVRSKSAFSAPRLAQASTTIERTPSRRPIGPVPVPNPTPEVAEPPAEADNAPETNTPPPTFQNQRPFIQSPFALPASPARQAAPPAEEVIAADQGPDVLTASLHLKRGVLPPPLKGSRASLERQNERTEAEGLERIEDEDDLADRIARKALVPVPVSLALTINGNLPANHRYCRPWTARFLADLAQSHAAQFHRPLEVSSAVRTVAYQKRLMGINGNAAAAEGDIVSPHLTGATIDIAKSPLSREEIGWMRSHLLALQLAGKIDVEEEFQQSCFHITVYKSYAPPAPPVVRKPRQRHSNPPVEIAATGL
jgi:hypothetical protein